MLLLLNLAVLALPLYGEVHLVAETAVPTEQMSLWINEDWNQADIQWTVSRSRIGPLPRSGRLLVVSGQVGTVSTVLEVRIGNRTIELYLPAEVTASEVARRLGELIVETGGTQTAVEILPLQPGSTSQHTVFVFEGGHLTSAIEVLQPADAGLSVFATDMEEGDCVLQLAEAAHVAAHNHDGKDHTIEMFVVRDSYVGASKRGMATVELQGWPPAVFVAAPRANFKYGNSHMPGHELGHLLLGTAIHHDEPDNLMFENLNANTTVLTPQQRDDARNSPLLRRRAPAAVAAPPPGKPSAACVEVPGRKKCARAELFAPLLQAAETSQEALAATKATLDTRCEGRIDRDEILALSLLANRGGEDLDDYTAVVERLRAGSVGGRLAAPLARSVEILDEYYSDRGAYRSLETDRRRAAFLEIRMRRAYDPASQSWARDDWLTGGSPVATWAVEEWDALRRDAPHEVARRIETLAEEGQIGRAYLAFLSDVETREAD